MMNRIQLGKIIVYVYTSMQNMLPTLFHRRNEHHRNYFVRNKLFENFTCSAVNVSGKNSGISIAT